MHCSDEVKSIEKFVSLYELYIVALHIFSDCFFPVSVAIAANVRHGIA